MRCSITPAPGGVRAKGASRYDYFRPDTLDELFKLRQEHPDARYIAGGTDVMVRVRSRIESPHPLISLRNIEALKGIDVGGPTRIGACTTIAELIEHPELSDHYPVLIQAAKALGSAQIRNAATLAGNICNASPCADTALPLLVLEARVGVVGLGGRREVGIEEFFAGPGKTWLKPDEIVEALLLPPPNPDTRGLFLKKRRVQMDLSIASVAVLLELAGDKCLGARIAAGSVAPTPIRLHDAEAALEGKPIDAEVLGEAQALAQKAVSPIDDIRSSAAYRRQIVGVYVRRAVEQLLGWSAS